MEMKMTSEEFRALLEKFDGNSLKTLIEKNATYSENHNGDCLHNFRAGAEIMGGTPAQAAWGYMTKHLVALRDMIDRDDFSDLDNLLEKCQDINNYIRFIWCIGNERNKLLSKYKAKKVSEDVSSQFDTARFAMDSGMAEKVVALLRSKIIQNGYVTVGEFFDAIDCDPSDQDRKFLDLRWTDASTLIPHNTSNISWITATYPQ